MYDPSNYHGILSQNTVTVKDAIANLTSNIISGSTPLTVTFNATQSIGTSAILTIIDGPVIWVSESNDISTWITNYTFNDIGIYNIALSVRGGNTIKTTNINIEVLPQPPQDSASAIIRAISIKAEATTYQQLETEGDEV